MPDANKMMDRALARFVTESNAIEGITREPLQRELLATKEFVQRDRISLTVLEDFVTMIEPGAMLRRYSGMNVQIGGHHPPPGGSQVETDLRYLLHKAHFDLVDPWKIHVAYETQHPFMDGNGRSGRAIWAWMMLHGDHRYELKLGFLHAFYYQTLSQERSR